MVLAAGYTNCNTSSTIDGADKSHLQQISDADQEIKIKTTKYAEVLRTTYLTLSYGFPDMAILQSIRGSSGIEEAKNIYNQAIDNLIDSRLMEKRFQNYFKVQFGVWSDSPADNQKHLRYPVNLAVYTMLSDVSINELFLADYAINDNYNPIDENYQFGPPKEEMAGFITLKAYADVYITDFKFDVVREVLGFLNTAAPYTDIDIYRWDSSMLAFQYRYDPEVSEINCESCHVVNNWARLAFRNYRNTGAARFVPDQPQSLSQFTTEDQNGDLSLEPRDTGDTPYPEEDIENYVKLTENGMPIRNVRDFAIAITKHPEFPRAWTERFLTIILSLEEGTAGPNKVVPDHFEGTEDQQAFLTKWTEVFESQGRVTKEFFRTFLKSDDYINIK